MRTRRAARAMVVPGLMRRHGSAGGTRTTVEPAREAVLGGGGPPVEGEGEQPVGVDEEHRARRVGRDAHVSTQRAALGPVAEAHLDRPRRGGAGGEEVVGSDVELAVPEPVDPPDLRLRWRRPRGGGEGHEAGEEGGGVDGVAEVGEGAPRARRGGGGEDVAAGERGAGGGQLVVGGG